MKTRLPARDRAMVAAHEAGMHDKKPRPETCRQCAQDALPVPTDIPSPIRKHDPDPVITSTRKRLSTAVREAEPTEATVDIETREAWMLRGVEKWRPAFKALGHDLPPVRVSIGWPGGRGSRKDVLGQCWAPTAVEDQVPAIFVSPVQGDPVEVLETIGHELIHALNHGWAHRKPFQDVARNLGFTNGAKTKTSRAESPDLYARLDAWAADLGPFGHSRVNAGGEGSGKAGWKLLRPPVQSTRMIKVFCPNDGYTVRTTRKWLALATPACPLCDDTMTVDEGGAA